MWTLVLVGATAATACVSVGGGLYEARVVDPFWPRRPGIIQPALGGISRRRFWVPAHAGLEVLLLLSIILTWSHFNERAALLVALASHLVTRIWSLVDVVPKAVAFEKADPAKVDEAAALRWTRRSLARLPLGLITAAATLAALAAAR